MNRTLGASTADCQLHSTVTIGYLNSLHCGLPSLSSEEGVGREELRGGMVVERVACRSAVEECKMEVYHSREL